MSDTRIPFNKTYVTGREIEYIETAIKDGGLSGGGTFAKLCQNWLETDTGCHRAFVVHSGTAALELGALLLGIRSGDEVIMPSFTFVTTATAILLRGGIPVFVDIRPDTLNIDETAIQRAITSKTKAILPVHYAGVGCEMDEILSIASSHGVKVLEDAAHGVKASYGGRPLGSLGQVGALSFHDTKNLTCGEGGALLVNDPGLVERAEILVEKGTDRARFFLGLVDKYTWRDIGSSFLLSEIEAAFLWAQMEKAEDITAFRLSAWGFYHRLFAALELRGVLQRPFVPQNCSQNAHMYYLLVKDGKTRNGLLNFLGQQGIATVFHYVPLHNSPAGQKFARVCGSLAVTMSVSERLLRLPMWVGLSAQDQLIVARSIYDYFGVVFPRELLESIPTRAT